MAYFQASEESYAPVSIWIEKYYSGAPSQKMFIVYVSQ